MRETKKTPVVKKINEYVKKRKEKQLYKIVVGMIALFVAIGVAFILRMHGLAWAVSETKETQVYTQETEAAETPPVETTESAQQKTQVQTTGDKGRAVSEEEEYTQTEMETETETEGTTEAETVEESQTETESATQMQTETEPETENVEREKAKVQVLAVSEEDLSKTAGDDITENIIDVQFYIKAANKWEIVPDDYIFSEDEQVKAQMEFLLTELENVDKPLKTYIKLPDSMNLPKELTDAGSSPFYVNSGYEKQAGTYYFGEDGRIYLIFETEYLQWVKEHESSVHGYVDFEFTWELKEEEVKDESIEISLGKYKGTVKIKKKDENTDSDDKLGYSVQKQYTGITFSDGKATFTYEIGIDVSKDQKDKIILKDKIDLSNGTYELTGSQYWDKDGKEGSCSVSLEEKNTDSESCRQFVIGDDTGVKKGYYKIRYTVTYDLKDVQDEKITAVNNKLEYGDDYYTTAIASTRKNLFNKWGENKGDGYTDWTVNVNNGVIPYTFKTDEQFTDTLPAGTKLDGDVTIIQTDADGKETGEKITAEVVENEDGTTTISATLPKGTYRYKITYRTKTELSFGESTIVENKAGLDGDKKADTSAEVKHDPAKIKKEMGEVPLQNKTYYEVNGEKYEVFEIPWKVTVSQKITAGTTYHDTNVAWTTQKLFMSDVQRKAMTVKAGDKLLTAGTDYEVTASDKEDGLFQITFLKDFSEMVTLDYTSYVDITDVKSGEGFNVCNEFEGITAGGYLTKKYKKDSEKLYKYVNGSTTGEYNFSTESSIEIGTDRKLNWTVVAKDAAGWYLKEGEDLVFTDTLPAGLSFDTGSLKIVLNYWINVTQDADSYEVTTQKQTDGSVKVTIKIHAFSDYIKSKSDFTQTPLQRVEMTYDTYITDEDFLNGDATSKEYTNKIEWGDEFTHQTIDVKRDVIGKNGSYDEKTGILQYAVIINPDASDLNPDGDLLKVVDTLTKPDDITVKLGEVSLYTITKDIDGENGTTKLAPGAFITKLAQVDKPADKLSEATTNTFCYDEETNRITAYIPDNKAYALVYTYQIMDKLANNISIGNEAELYAEKKQYSGKKQWTTVISSSSSVVVSSDAIGIMIIKRDSSYYNKKLGGATFQLFKWDESAGQFIKRNTYTTGEDTGVAYIVQSGNAIDEDPQKNVVYCLEEIEAPKGYDINPEKKYFVFSEDKEKVIIPAGLSEDDIQWLSYAPGNVVKLEWFDDRESISIKVEKKWKDETGNDISRNQGEISFDLYRRAVSVSDNLSAMLTLTEDELTQIENDYAAYKQAHKYEYVSTYTINPRENHEDWSLTIDKLPKLDETMTMQYQYYVVETEMTTGSDNDKWVGTVYETDDDQMSISIINTITSEYRLPDTGGPGTLPERLRRWFQNILWNAGQQLFMWKH